MNIIGKKIKRIRIFRKKTQVELANKVGLTGNRIIRYESGDRTPKIDMVKKIADALYVNEFAISDIDLESDIGIMHLLFYLEDNCGLKVCKRINPQTNKPEYNLHFDEHSSSITTYLKDWYEEYEKDLGNNTQYTEAQKHKYDEWRYTFPEPLIKRTREMIDEYDQSHSKEE